jgi:hypothetical protein
MIAILKLVSGAEIVGKVLDSNSTHVTVDKPLQINYRYFVGSAPTASFIRYCLFGSDETTTLSFDHIISQHSIRDAFSKIYEDNAEYYYGEHQQTIDRELESVSADQQSARDEHLKKLLEMMPVDGAPIN